MCDEIISCSWRSVLRYRCDRLFAIHDQGLYTRSAAQVIVIDIFQARFTYNFILVILLIWISEIGIGNNAGISQDMRSILASKGWVTSDRYWRSIYTRKDSWVLKNLQCLGLSCNLGEWNRLLACSIPAASTFTDRQLAAESSLCINLCWCE